MHLRIASVIVPVLVVTAGVARAITPGTYNFAWDHEDAGWLEFTSGIFITQGLTSDSWDADVDISGNLMFDDDNAQLHATSALADGVAVNTKLVIEGVTGTWTPSTTSGDWQITAHFTFSAAGVFGAASCTTSSFSIDFNGDYDSSSHVSFVIPALSGTGTQACNAYYGTINMQFGLGSSGSEVHFDKFVITAE